VQTDPCESRWRGECVDVELVPGDLDPDYLDGCDRGSVGGGRRFADEPDAGDPGVRDGVVGDADVAVQGRGDEFEADADVGPSSPDAVVAYLQVVSRARHVDPSPVHIDFVPDHRDSGGLDFVVSGEADPGALPAGSNDGVIRDPEVVEPP
jgi:hypothetical protein